MPPADYRLVARRAAGECGDVYSFCMCPGGEILLTNEVEGVIATNGASRAARRGRFANCGLVITLDPGGRDADPLKLIASVESWERRAFSLTGGVYSAPAQRARDFLAGRPSSGKLETSCPVGAVWAELRQVVPRAVSEAIARALPMVDQRMPGFAGDQALLTGPESRVSAPVRILRDRETRESVAVSGLYPVGEGAGYAGGIISSAVDGMRSAEVVMRRHAPAR